MMAVAFHHGRIGITPPACPRCSSSHLPRAGDRRSFRLLATGATKSDAGARQCRVLTVSEVPSYSRPGRSANIASHDADEPVAARRLMFKALPGGPYGRSDGQGMHTSMNMNVNMNMDMDMDMDWTWTMSTD